MSIELAIDPGETTGLALSVGGVLYTSMTKLERDVWSLVSLVDTCIVENFVTSGVISRYGLHTVRLVGAVEALCWQNEVQFVRQMPGYRRVFLPEAEKLMPPHSKHENRHEKDAISHLLAYEQELRQQEKWRVKRGRTAADEGEARPVEGAILHDGIGLQMGERNSQDDRRTQRAVRCTYNELFSHCQRLERDIGGGSNS